MTATKDDLLLFSPHVSRKYVNAIMKKRMCPSPWKNMCDCHKEERVWPSQKKNEHNLRHGRKDGTALWKKRYVTATIAPPGKNVYLPLSKHVYEQHQGRTDLAAVMAERA